jgi:hypothetical protein
MKTDNLTRREQYIRNQTVAQIVVNLCPPFNQQYFADMLGYTKQRLAQILQDYKEAQGE